MDTHSHSAHTHSTHTMCTAHRARIHSTHSTRPVYTQSTLQGHSTHTAHTNTTHAHGTCGHTKGTHSTRTQHAPFSGFDPHAGLRLACPLAPRGRTARLVSCCALAGASVTVSVVPSWLRGPPDIIHIPLAWARNPGTTPSSSALLSNSSASSWPPLKQTQGLTPP